MKKSTLLTSCAIAIAGYYMGSHLGTGHTAPENHDDSSSESALHASAGGESSEAIQGKLGKREATARYSKLRSVDTLETLRQLPIDSPDLYRRLSLWLLDASKQDIAAYWQTFSQHDGFPNDITDLIFINWTRIDPKDATESLAGSKYEHYAWWAWACQDPKGALDAAMTANPDRINNVAWGIGEFHHKWMMEHFDEIPEPNRDNAIQGFMKWADSEDPLAAIDWLKSKNMNLYGMDSLWKSAITHDPWGAFEWMKQNQDFISQNMGSDRAVKAICESLAQDDANTLQSLISQTPSGAARRQMEEIQFNQLIESDPEAALAKADQTKSKNIALERYAEVGLKFAETDPDKAFSILEKIAANNPGITQVVQSSTEIAGNPGGWSATNSGEIVALCSKLLEIDPGRAAEIQLSQETSGNHQYFVGNGSPAESWASNDPEGYAEWLNKQEDESLKQKGTRILVNQLISSDRYEEALLWQMNTDRKSISSTYSRWYQADPESAAQWKQQTDLTEQEEKSIQSIEGIIRH